MEYWGLDKTPPPPNVSVRADIISDMHDPVYGQGDVQESLV